LISWWFFANRAGSLKAMKQVATAVAIIAACYHMLVVGQVFTLFGFFLSPITHRAISLLFALSLLYVIFPARKGSTKRGLPWYDILLLLLCVVIPLGFIIAFPEAMFDYSEYGTLDLKGVIFTYTLMLAVLEGARRAGGSIVLPALMLTVFLMTLFNNYMPALLHGSGFSLNELGFIFYVGTHGFFGVPTRVASTIIAMFMVFSQTLRATGGSDWLIKLALCLVGSSKGGAAKAAVVASAFFGTISGSPSSNAAATGIVTIPLMKKAGYRPEFAAAVEATASTGGQILPPVMGAVAFIMAEWLSIRYVDVVFAAIVPALLYFLVVFYGVHIRAVQHNLEAIPREAISPVLLVIKEGWFYTIPLGVLVYLLIVAQYPAEVAAFAGTLSMLVLGVFVDKEKRKLSFPSLRDAGIRVKGLVVSLGDGMKIWFRVAVICAAVGILIGCFTHSGVGLRTAAFIIEFSGERLIFVMVLVALAAYVLGMGIDTLPLYITMAILVAPALEKLDVLPISAHLFVLFWGLTSNLTPPVCLAVYVTSAIAESNIWRTGLEAMRLGVVLFVLPFAFVYYPALHLQGSLVDIAAAISRTLIATAGITGGLTGFFLRGTTWIQRIFLIGGGLLLLIHGNYIWAVGVGLLLTVGLWQRLGKTKGVRIIL
jgi:TRAP transporter 4TM/12TM fusion protein